MISEELNLLRHTEINVELMPILILVLKEGLAIPREIWDIGAQTTSGKGTAKVGDSRNETRKQGTATGKDDPNVSVGWTCYTATGVMNTLFIHGRIRVVGYAAKTTAPFLI